MTTIRELANDFNVLGARRTQILTTCRVALKDGLDDILRKLDATGSANGFWKSLYLKIQDENRRIYPLPNQDGVRTTADNYAGGVIERMKEAILFNHSDPSYVDFLRRYGRLPVPGDNY